MSTKIIENFVVEKLWMHSHIQASNPMVNASAVNGAWKCIAHGRNHDFVFFFFSFLLWKHPFGFFLTVRFQLTCIPQLCMFAFPNSRNFVSEKEKWELVYKIFFSPTIVDHLNNTLRTINTFYIKSLSCNLKRFNIITKKKSLFKI